ncbi:MAG: hypothetical protein ACFCU2_01865 [Acidimicrobiia bacterium]
MTIWEYLKDPDPWFNTAAYTPLQIAMFTAGAVLWVVVYLITIRRLVTLRTLSIPFIAVTLNFGTEITTSIFFVPDMGLALVLAYWAWMVLDVLIVIGLFRYGGQQVRSPFLQARFRMLMAVWIPLLFAVQSTLILRYDLPMAPLVSFTINLVMSVAFIGLLFVPGTESPSKLIGWCKFIGTGVIGVMFYTKYPDNNALTSLYVAVALVDVYYVYLLHSTKVEVPHAFSARIAS